MKLNPTHPDIVLASVSPRRRELLGILIKDFRVVPSTFDESSVPEELAPDEHVLFSASMKARDVARQIPGSLVIGADTVVVVDNIILGKPQDAADAARMLNMLGGRAHQVYTGISGVLAGKEINACECTNVVFRPLDDDIISRYVATGEPFDKAGAYAIQGLGSVLVARIEGCFFNVVGLPLYRLSLMLSDFGLRIP